MYGYVRICDGELKIIEKTLYRAFYCGLCREMGRRTGLSSRVSLSYDAAFLAIVRCAVTGERVSVSQKRCFVHPLKKRFAVDPNDALDDVACASAILVRAKLDDVKADERGAKRLASSLAVPWADRWQRKANSRLDGLENRLRQHLDKLTELENAKCESVDEAAGAFGALLGEVASFGVEGDEAILLREIGDLVGRFIYVCDACDDAADDLRLGRYNPLIEIYGDSLCEKRTVFDLRGRSNEREVLRPEIADEINGAAMMLIARLDSATDLIDFTTIPEGITINRQLNGIIKNVVRFGMPAQLRLALGRVDPTVFGAKYNINDTAKEADLK